jgi:hypothetical protein
MSYVRVSNFYFLMITLDIIARKYKDPLVPLRSRSALAAVESRVRA